MDLAKEEIPTKDTYDYVLFVPDKVEEQEETTAEGGEKVEIKKGPSKGYLIYCLDVSGSMNAQTEMSRVSCKLYDILDTILHYTSSKTCC